MLKKFLSVILTAALVVSMSSCGSSKSAGKDPYAVVVDKGLFKTEISVPREFAISSDIEPEGSVNDPFKIIDVAKKTGVKDIMTKGNGTVVLKMKNSLYDDFLTQTKIAMDEYAKDFIEQNEDTCSFRTSSHDIKFTEFNIMVASKEYAAADISSTMPFYFLGTLYQSLAKAEKDEIETAVNIMDEDTENLFHKDSLNFDEYIDIIDGSSELSTEEQDITKTKKEEEGSDASSAASSETSKDSKVTTTAGTTAATQATTVATTAATTATTAATTVATTAATTATTAATTAATQATTAQSNRDLPAGDYKDMGSGSIRITNPSDNSAVITGTPSSTVNIRLSTENFDITHTAYIYIDGMLAAKARLDAEQDLQLQGSFLSAGQHKVEVVQYGNDDSDNAMITYKTASYQVKAQ